MKKLITAILFIITLTTLTTCGKDGAVIKPNEFFNIPLNEISETISYHSAIINDVSIEVLAFKTSDGSIRTAFNACERCYTTGKGHYTPEDSGLICQQCKMRINIDTIGIESGGCQPIPILDENKTLTDDLIRIPYDVLAANVHWFVFMDME